MSEEGMMDVFEAIRKRRSVRKFKPGEVSEADVREILQAGRRAPTGCNAQDKELIVIRDADTIAKLNDVQGSFENVPVVIGVVMSTEETPSWGSYWVEDCAACVENMLLAITALGYASVWVEGTLLRKEDWAKELLGVPADKRLYVLLPVGHAAEEGEMAPKRPLDEIVHYEQYGNLKPRA
jgi:nitroreductase